ncbi:MAG: metal-dependent hydrolase [Thermodesulfobacteriota bacterium]
MFVFGHAGLSLMFYHLLGRGGTNHSPLARPSQVGAVIFFALLPDLLDKPVTLWLLQDATSTRWLGHSLVFSVSVCAAVHFLWPSLRRWVWACPGHLLLDAMWRSPHTLMFPLLGWEMDPGTDPNISFWDLITGNLSRLLTEPQNSIPEIAGLVFLTAVLARLGLWYLAQPRSSHR